MGVHTGDSITVAPAQTLTDKEYQTDARRLDRGDPRDRRRDRRLEHPVRRRPGRGRMVVIEMNPRVSRSSALASKATGFPIAKIAAKLAVGYTLDEIANDITRDDARLLRADHRLRGRPRSRGSRSRNSPTPTPIADHSMKSVGEAMAIGRTFQESAAESAALARERRHRPGRDRDRRRRRGGRQERRPRRARHPDARPPVKVAQAMRRGFSDEEIHALCGSTPGSARSSVSS